MTENMMTHDANEGICAFIEKRKAQWQSAEPLRIAFAMPRPHPYIGAGRNGIHIRYSRGRGLTKRMSNPKFHHNPVFASGPLISAFAKEAAEKGRECWNRTTRKAASMMTTATATPIFAAYSTP